MTKKYLTFLQTKELLNTTNGHLRSLIFHRKIPHIKIGRLIRFDYEELIQWIDSSKVNGGIYEER